MSLETRFPECKAAGVALFNAAGQLLVGLKADKKNKKKLYQEPGGKREKNESIIDCAKRELAEETSLQDSEIDFVNPIYDSWCKYVCFMGSLGAEQPKLSNTFSEFKYININEDKPDFSFRLKRVLSLLRERQSSKRKLEIQEELASDRKRALTASKQTAVTTPDEHT